VNRGVRCRVSLELTILYRREAARRHAPGRGRESQEGRVCG
jgi:hypothetical protein